MRGFVRSILGTPEKVAPFRTAKDKLGGSTKHIKVNISAAIQRPLPSLTRRTLTQALVLLTSSGLGSGRAGAFLLQKECCDSTNENSSLAQCQLDRCDGYPHLAVVVTVPVVSQDIPKGF